MQQFTDSHNRYQTEKKGAAIGHVLTLTDPDRNMSCDYRGDSRVQAVCSCGWKGARMPHRNWHIAHGEYATHLESLQNEQSGAFREAA